MQNSSTSVQERAASPRVSKRVSDVERWLARRIGRIALAVGMLGAISSISVGVAREPDSTSSSEVVRTPSRSSRSYATAGDALDDERRAKRDLFIKGLLDLAAWCTDNELYLERDKLYRQVIELEPDNLDARKGLRFARNPDGSWKEPAPRAATNRSDRALPLMAAKRGETMRPYCDALLEFVERTKAEPPVKQKVVDEVLSLDPDNPRLHRWFGDVEVDGRWMTPESAAGNKRRAEIGAIVKASRAALPPAVRATGVPSASGANGANGIPGATGPKVPDHRFKVALETAHVRVLGDLPEAECGELARTTEIAADVVHCMLDCPIDFADKYTIYAFTGQEEKDAFVAKIKLFTVEGRALMLSRPIVGLDGTDDLLLGGADAPKRLDGAVRYMIARLLSRAFSLGDRNAWLGDGFGAYVTREICGTRSTWFILGASGKEQAPLAARISAPKSNWLDEALKLLQSEKPMSLASVVTLDIRSMRVEDMLCAHALAAFVIEGHPAELAPLMKGVGAGGTSPELLEKMLGSPMDELRTRLIRWLRERR
jgi:hypothetical protein